MSARNDVHRQAVPASLSRPPVREVSYFHASCSIPAGLIQTGDATDIAVEAGTQTARCRDVLREDLNFNSDSIVKRRENLICAEAVSW